MPIYFSWFITALLTLIVQLFLLASVAVQVEVETANGAFVEFEMPVRVVLRFFFNVKLLAALVVPTFVFGKV
jgi:hypothetical protein